MKEQLIILFCIFLLVMAASSCKQEDEIKHPAHNILYIMSDDHAYQAISDYSKELIQTPNIDQIASEGLLFTHSFVGNSICAPSRATMLPLSENFFDTYKGRRAAAEQKQSIRTNDMHLRYDLKLQDEEELFPWRFLSMDHTGRMNDKQKKAWKVHYDPIKEEFLAKKLEGEELYR